MAKKGNVGLPCYYNRITDESSVVEGVNLTERDFQKLAKDNWDTHIYFIIWGYPEED